MKPTARLWAGLLTSTPVWRSGDRPTTPARGTQFSLRDVMLATTLVAVVLGLTSLTLGGDWQGLWKEIGPMPLLCLLGWVALVILPCLWAAWGNLEFGKGLVFLFGGVGLYVICVIGIVLVVGAPIVLLLLTFGIGGFFCHIGLIYYSMKILEARGYVLVTHPSQIQEHG